MCLACLNADYKKAIFCNKEELASSTLTHKEKCADTMADHVCDWSVCRYPEMFKKWPVASCY